MNEETFKIKELEVTKINLKRGDVLMVTIKSDYIDEEIAHSIRKQLSGIFTENKVALYVMGTQDEVRFSIVSSEETRYPDTSEKDVGDEETQVIETAGECND